MGVREAATPDLEVDYFKVDGHLGFPDFNAIKRCLLTRMCELGVVQQYVVCENPPPESLE